MGHIKLIAVGRIKTAHWQQAVKQYEQGLARFCKYSLHTVKDAESHLPLGKRLELEAVRVRKLVQSGDVLF